MVESAVISKLPNFNFSPGTSYLMISSCTLTFRLPYLSTFSFHYSLGFLFLDYIIFIYLSGEVCISTGNVVSLKKKCVWFYIKLSLQKEHLLVNRYFSTQHTITFVTIDSLFLYRKIARYQDVFSHCHAAGASLNWCGHTRFNRKLNASAS